MRDGLTVKVTGAAGYGADAIKVFGNINGTLLGVTALVVLILLIIIYRSPIFWAIPFFTVLLAESSARGFGYLIAEAGVTINGQSGGILPVLVFGAGTDYALLLVSRYREELRRHEDKHEAMRVALRTAGPAILASGLTVILALLTLSLAEVNGTAGLGPIGAMGVGIAMISMLTMLPALLVIFGRKAFWSPFFDTIPHVGQTGADETHGTWRRIGERVAAGPRRIWVGGTLLLVLLSMGVTQIDTGLTNSNSFRGDVESVEGAEILARSFPSGALGAHERDRPGQGQGGAGEAALEGRRDLVAQVLPAAGRPARHALRRRPAPRPVLDRRLRPDPRAAPDGQGRRRLERARRRPDRGVLRLPRVGDARQLRGAAARVDRGAGDPRDPAALAAGAGAARPVGDPVLLRRARRPASSSSSTSSASPASTRRCRCSRSSSSSRWGSTTTSS